MRQLRTPLHDKFIMLAFHRATQKGVASILCAHIQRARLETILVVFKLHGINKKTLALSCAIPAHIYTHHSLPLPHLSGIFVVRHSYYKHQRVGFHGEGGPDCCHQTGSRLSCVGSIKNQERPLCQSVPAKKG